MVTNTSLSMYWGGRGVFEHESKTLTLETKVAVLSPTRSRQ